MRRAGVFETCIGVFILALLAAIACGVYLYGASSRNGAHGQRPSVSRVPASVLSSLPGDLVPFGREETFDARTLSDKIDGKADLYLSTGFVRLTVRRFASRADAKSWIELCVYHMQNPEDAFSVYSLQRRKDSKPIELKGPQSDGAVWAYRTEDAIFFASGADYFEITSSSRGLMDDMTILATNLVKAQPRYGALRTESFFPRESLDRSSISLHMRDVFAFSGLDRVYTAVYTDRGRRVTAFISRRESPQEAARIAAAYGRFLLENGGKAQGVIKDAPGSQIYKVFDTYEVVVHRGRFFAGVHDADNLKSAEDIAMRVYRKLGETVR